MNIPEMFGNEGPRYKTHGTQSLLKQHQTVAIAPIRVNTKKLPEDFFKNQKKYPPLPHRLVYRIKEKSSTERNCQNAEASPQKIDEILPQAQITSFFKVASSSNATTEMSSKNNRSQKDYGNQSFTHVALKPNQSDKDYTQSIQLSRECFPNSIKDELLWTFSRKNQTNSHQKILVPLKKNPTLIQSDLEMGRGRSTELLKKTKKEVPQIQFPQTSRKRRKSIDLPNCNHSSKTQRKSSFRTANNKKIEMDLLLPKIKRS